MSRRHPNGRNDRLKNDVQNYQHPPKHKCSYQQNYPH